MVGSSSEVHASGTDAVVVRRATGPEAARLRATGERLAAAAHPGVVEVVSSHGTDEEWELSVVHAGRPVDIVGPLSVEQVAAIAAALAATLADLHAAGIVHGRIDSSHVLIGAHGRPVLCGFGPPVGLSPGPEDDIAAVGALIVELLGVDPHTHLLPERRWSPRGRRDGWDRRSLLLIADHACAEPSTRRPTARRLAAQIASVVPGASPPTAARAEVEVQPPVGVADGRGARLPSLLGAVLGVAVLGLGALRIAEPGVRPEVVVSAPTAPATTVAATTLPAELDQVAVSVDGTAVTIGASRYQVGEPGDIVVVGDWDGDAVPTAALLRPRTGEVFVFHTWASKGGDVVVEAADRVEGAVDLVAEAGPHGDQLRVRRADGSWRPILVRDAA